MTKWLTPSERIIVNSNPKIPSYTHRSSNDNYPSYKETSKIEGTKVDSTKYTGNYVIGIATMHKSNAVPITSKDAAKDVAKMRRN